MEKRIKIIGRYVGKNKNGITIHGVKFRPHIYSSVDIDIDTYNFLLDYEKADLFEFYNLVTRDEAIKMLSELVQGPRGPQGEKGDVGEKGPKGYTGLKGITGPRGEQGEQGIEGIIGAPGVKGFKGIKGVDGEQGPQGESSESALAEIRINDNTLKAYLDSQFKTTYYNIRKPITNTIIGSDIITKNSIRGRTDTTIIGKTIQNLWMDSYFDNATINGISNELIEEHNYKMTPTTTEVMPTLITSASEILLKPSTEYTFIRDINCRYPIFETIIFGNSEGVETELSISQDSTGTLKNTFVTPSDFSYLKYRVELGFINTEAHLGNIMILVGDMTSYFDNERAKYFNGLANVELSKATLISSSKNMVSPSERFKESDWQTDNYDAMSMNITEEGYIEITKNLDFTSMQIHMKNEVSLKANLKYKVCIVGKSSIENTNASVFLLHNDSDVFHYPQIQSTKFTECISGVFTPQEDMNITIAISSTDMSLGETLTIKGVFICEVTNDDEEIGYAHYIENVVNFPNSDIALKGFAGGVKDTLTLDGVYTQSVGVLQFSSSQNWTRHTTEKDETSIFRLPLADGKSSSLLMSNNFTTDNGGDYERLGLINDILYVGIKKSRLSSDTAEGFKEWIDNNPTLLYYEKKKPIVKNIGIQGYLYSYEKSTSIKIESNIITDLQVNIPCTN